MNVGLRKQNKKQSTLLTISACVTQFAVDYIAEGPAWSMGPGLP